MLATGTETEVAAGIDLQLVALGTFRGDQYHTERRTGTVNGSGRSVFQYGYIFDIRRIDAGQLRRAHRHIVNQDKRVVTVDGTHTTDIQRRSLVGTTASTRNVQVRDQTLQTDIDVRDGPVDNILITDSLYRTGKVHFLLHAITYHNHLVQRLGILLQRNVEYSLSADTDFLSHISDI